MANNKQYHRRIALRFLFLFLFLLSVLSSCANKESELWYCPMHPSYTAPRKGPCPICGMDLVTKEEESKSGETSGSKDHGEHSKSDAVKARSFHLTPEKEALIGIKVFKVVRQNMVKKIQSPGRIAYAPEMYQALIEYNQALRLARTLRGLSPSDKSLSSSDITQPAKTKLRMMGLSDREIHDLSRINLNELILGGTKGRTHVFSQIFESDIGYIKQGQKIEVNVVAYPGQIFYGKILGLGTVLDPKNRSLRIHAEIIDRKNLLRPQMFATVGVIVNLGKVLVIPKSSVIDTGIRQIVYKRIGSGRYTPNSVKIGRETENFYEVLEGLKIGDEIAYGGTFMLDSEAKLMLHEPQNEHSH